MGTNPHRVGARWGQTRIALVVDRMEFAQSKEIVLDLDTAASVKF